MKKLKVAPPEAVFECSEGSGSAFSELLIFFRNVFRLVTFCKSKKLLTGV